MNRGECVDGPHPEGAKLRRSGGRRSAGDAARPGPPAAVPAGPLAPAAGAPVCAPGLSMVHIPSRASKRPRPARGEVLPVLEVAHGGRWARLSHGVHEAPAGGPRGVVSGFSPASRRRMLRKVLQVDHDAAPRATFVTLTMPGTWGRPSTRELAWLVYGGGSAWKKALDVWLHRLRRRFPLVWGIWKLEPQKRGAPHFHLLLWGLPASCAEWVARSWWEVVGSGEPDHLAAGTRTEWLRSVNGTVYYCAKYCAKVVTEDLGQDWATAGRWWGCHQWKLAPVRVVADVLTDEQWVRVRREFRKWLRKRGVRLGRCESTSSGPWPARVGVTAYLPAADVARLAQFVRSSDPQSQPCPRSPSTVSKPKQPPAGP